MPRQYEREPKQAEPDFDDFESTDDFDPDVWERVPVYHPGQPDEGLPRRNLPAQRHPGYRGPAPQPPQASRRSRLGLKAVVAALAIALFGTAGGLVVAWVQSEPRPVPEDTAILATEDTYVVEQEPGVDHSAAAHLFATNTPRQRATAYLKFDVPPLPQPGNINAARLETTSDSPQPAGVQVFRVPDTTWAAAELIDSGPPAHGDLVATTPTPDGSTTMSFDLTRVVTTSGTFAFAVTSPPADRPASMFSSEHGVDGPRLIVTWTPDRPRDNTPPEAMIQPGISPPGSPGPTPSFTSSFGPSAPPGPGIPPGNGSILAGASVQLRTGETYAQGIARADQTYGPLEMVRVFNAGLPPSWGGSRPEVANRTSVVSFKANPRDVNAGRHDTLFTNWFAGVPRDRDTYWVYYHEPEDNIEGGDFSASDYRAAWRRLAGLADRAGNPRLRATLVLMCFSVNPGSGRNWRDYYAGDDVIDVLGWDCYNFGRKKGEYASPSSIYGKSIEISRSVGKPFGYAEMGSVLLPGDSGAGRAAWLRSVGAFLHSQGPLWMSYFDSKLDVDFRLLDGPSQQAWMSVCRA